MTMKVTHYYIYIGVLAAGMLLAGCSKDNSDSTQQVGGEPQEIRVQTNVTSMLKGSRTTIDNNTALQDYDLKIDAYYHDTETKYLNGKTLHYDNVNEPNAWKFWAAGAQEHYYWPFDGSTVAGGSTPASTLDFVGFCPFDKPAYIGDPTYNHSTGVSFTCDMSSYMTLASQSSMQEFLVSVLPNQTLATQTEEGGALPMVFKHPLAVIKFTITAASGTHVKINSISINGLKTAGTCTFDGSDMTWTGLTGSTDMTITQTLKYGTATTESTPFLVIPNNYGSKYLTVNATWDDWSNPVTISDYGTNVDFNWQAGYIYTYNLTLDKLGLKVDIAKYTEQW